MDENNNNTYIGYSRQNDSIWTIEFNLIDKPINFNAHFYVSKFKIIQIENKDGDLLNKEECGAKDEIFNVSKPIHVFLKKEDLYYNNFYNLNREKYLKHTGEINEYHCNGNLFCSYFLISGKLNGKFISKTKDGKYIEESFFVDNLRHGLSKYISHSDNLCLNYEISLLYNMGMLVDTSDENRAIEQVYFKPIPHPTINSIIQKSCKDNFKF